MKQLRRWAAFVLAVVMSLSLAACGGNPSNSTAGGSNSGEQETQESETDVTASSDALVIAEQGIFSAGGRVIQSDGTFDVSNYYTSREGSTSHVDHANVLYQIPENDTELPIEIGRAHV